MYQVNESNIVVQNHFDEDRVRHELAHLDVVVSLEMSCKAVENLLGPYYRYIQVSNNTP